MWSVDLLIPSNDISNTNKSRILFLYAQNLQLNPMSPSPIEMMNAKANPFQLEQLSFTRLCSV